jgi:hypothetical protein
MPLEKEEQKTGAIIFGIVFLLLIMLIAILIPDPSSFQYWVFRVVLALAAAGVVAMIPGFISVEVGNVLRAGSALAVFAIIYFFSPAKLIVQPAETIETPSALESLVSLEAGSFDAVQLIEQLTGLTGGITLDSKLTEKIKGREVKISAPQNSVSLRSVLDRIFTQIGIPVVYADVSGTVVISEKETS